MTLESAARAYAAFFETVTPETLPELRRLCAPAIRFRDPFNDLTGIDSFMAVFEEMYATVEVPRFAVLHQAFSGQVCYLRWRFTGRLKGRKINFEIEGMTEVQFDAAGLVIAHIDHWDAAGQVYEKIPVLGSLLRFFRRRIAVKSD